MVEAVEGGSVVFVIVVVVESGDFEHREKPAR